MKKLLIMAFMITLILSVFVTGSSSASDQTKNSPWQDGHWETNFGFSGPGLDESVFALLTASDGSVYAGGSFTNADSVQANHVARWDGSSWQTLGEGVNDYVLAIAEGPDDKIYIGGEFNQANGIPANRIACWDGTEWSALGNGLDELNAYINSIVVSEDGTVFIGGHFYSIDGTWMNHIAQWDGTTWLPVGEGFNGDVNSLIFDMEGNLYAGGNFTASGAVSLSHLARWDGNTWTAVGNGTNEAVHQLLIGPNGHLIANGEFTLAGTTPVDYLAEWDNNVWHALTQGLTGSPKVIGYSNTGILYAGHYSPINGHYTLRWTGTEWTHLSQDVTGKSIWGRGGVNTIARGPAGSMYFGGFFTLADNQPANRIALWTGNQWQPVGQLTGELGINNAVDVLATGPDGKLYAGGEFTMAGNIAANRIARWDTDHWSALGDGFAGEVYAINFRGEDKILAGGISEDIFHPLKEWKDGSWSNLGLSFNNSTSFPVIFSLAADHTGGYYIGGNFTESNSEFQSIVLFTPNILRWDGESLYPLGDGLNGAPITMAVGPDGFLYAAGYITASGSQPLHFIVRWDGMEWSDVGGGTNGYVTSILFGQDGNLYISGSFSEAGGMPTGPAARWNGETWEGLAVGLDVTISSLAQAQNGDLLAVFSDYRIPRAPQTIRRWDGNEWIPIEGSFSGTMPVIRDIEFDENGRLWAGGQFESMDNSSSNNIAHWVVSSADLTLHVNADPEPVLPGAVLTYTLATKNLGPDEARQIVLQTTLPAEMTFQNASGDGWSCEFVEPNLTCLRDDLPSGAESPVILTVLTSPVSESSTLYAEIHAWTTDPRLKNNISQWISNAHRIFLSIIRH